MSVRQFQDNMLFDFDAIKAQCQLPPTSPAPIAGNKDKFASTERTRHMRRHISPKSSQESPWDTYQQAITYEVVGEVMIASRRTRPSRVVAIRKYRKQDSRRLIDRFGRLEHVNILSFHECYIYGDSAFFLVADLPLTLAHVVAHSDLYPTEAELGSIMCQILEGMCYLAAFGLAHQSLVCSNILLGLDGVIKIAGPEYCMDCPSSQSEAACIAAIPSIMMQLMQKCDKEASIIGVEDLERWPIESAAVGFLSVSGTAASLETLKKESLIASRHRPARDLVVLARVALLSTQIECTYHRVHNLI
ncbi:hypothetical protein N7523_010140 [Penicillium sp. IBT 18751x]|nr:hypothetical protein N7523_010140 [Penicillium sp. IBT 18751x]